MKRFCTFVFLLSLVSVLGCEPAKPAKTEAPKAADGAAAPDGTAPADGTTPAGDAPKDDMPDKK